MAKLTDQNSGLAHAQKISSCLWCNGNVEEVVNYYLSIFKNSGRISEHRYGKEVPGKAGTLLVSTFHIEGMKFMALDGGPQYSFTPAISFMVDCKDQPEVDELWNKLCEGGRPDRCGWLQDKFGVSWQIIPTALGEMMSDPDPMKSKRVFEAMLQMSKIDIAKLQEAYNQK